jgi:hypothetical protein
VIMDPTLAVCDRCFGPRCLCEPPDPPRWPDVYAYEVQADGTRVRLEAPTAAALLDLIREYDRRG